MFTQVVTTADEYTEDELNGSIIDVSKTKGSIKEYQKVIAVGPSVKNIAVGDLVMINPIRYAVKKHQAGSLKDGVVTDNPVVKYNIPIIELDHVPHLLLQDTDISFVISDYSDEQPPKKGTFILPENKVIM